MNATLEELRHDLLTNYVIDHYRHLLTDQESKIVSALNLKFKSLHSSSSAFRLKLIDRRNLLPDGESQRIFELGFVGGRRAVRDSMLRRHPEEIFLNYCTHCGSLCRTPVAHMCVSCGYTWHAAPDG